MTVEYVSCSISVLQTILASASQALMHRLIKSTVVRGTILLPFLISNVIAALVWLWLSGLPDRPRQPFISAIGLDQIPFFGDATGRFRPSPWSTSGDTWATPRCSSSPGCRPSRLRLRGGLAGRQHARAVVLADHLAAAPADPGAGPDHTVTGSFQVFDTVAVTTKGGPANASRVMQYYIYQKGFGEGQFGYASALSVILFIILITVAPSS